MKIKNCRSCSSKSLKYLYSLGIDIADVTQISSYLSKLHNLNLNVVSVIKRSDYKSGVYWVTIKIDK